MEKILILMRLVEHILKPRKSSKDVSINPSATENYTMAKLIPLPPQDGHLVNESM